jgi:hypothetical protein
MKIDALSLMVAVTPTPALDSENAWVYLDRRHAERPTPLPDFQGACAYLNRLTGEIVFVSDNFGETESWLGRDTAIDIVFHRAMVDANPDVWLKIPKGPNSGPEFDWEEHARAFLNEHGIEAEIA